MTFLNWDFRSSEDTSNWLQLKQVQFSSVTQLYPTLCDPMDCSTPDFPVHHQLSELAQTHVCRVGDAIQCHPTISSSVIPFSCLQSVPASGSFPMKWLFTSGGQSIGASASASALPLNIQGWFPSGWAGLILLCQGLSRVFSSTTVRKHQLFGAQPSLCSNSHICTWPLKTTIALTLRPQSW